MFRTRKQNTTLQDQITAFSILPVLLRMRAIILVVAFVALPVIGSLDAAPVSHPSTQHLDGQKTDGQAKKHAPHDSTKTDASTGTEHHGKMPAYWSMIPFLLILLGIAFLPMFAGHWWHNNWNKLLVSAILGIPTAAYLLYLGRSHELIHQLVLDYIPFIALLGALFYISGGIVLSGDIRATPVNNTIFLAVGSLLASFIGTTGASMVLIRPLLRTNSERKHVVHTVVFFIFCVSNIGGLLTPLGDPPLFLGYLKGVPFTWTFRLTPEWAFTLTILLILYFVWDTWAYRREEKKDIQHDDADIEPLSLRGQRNFFWLLGVILIVAFVNEQYEPFKSLIKQNVYWKLLQVPFLLGMIFLSKIFTPQAFRKANNFNMHPIEEVAFLFIGIFITMIPALIILKAEGAALGIQTPLQYFFATGIFSSFLDNAPTYLVFLALAEGQLPAGQQSVMNIVTQMPMVLAGISLGAVFMGAMTYIGNAPNFMVKAIAEERGITMPSFGGYMLYSISILGVVFGLVAVVFLL